MNEIYMPQETIILQKETPTPNVLGVSDSHKSQACTV